MWEEYWPTNVIVFYDPEAFQNTYEKAAYELVIPLLQSLISLQLRPKATTGLWFARDQRVYCTDTIVSNS